MPLDQPPPVFQPPVEVTPELPPVAVFLADCRQAHAQYQQAIREGRAQDSLVALKRAAAAMSQAHLRDRAHADPAWSDPQSQVFLYDDVMAFYVDVLTR